MFKECKTKYTKTQIWRKSETWVNRIGRTWGKRWHQIVGSLDVRWLGADVSLGDEEEDEDDDDDDDVDGDYDDIPNYLKARSGAIVLRTHRTSGT